MKEDLWRLLAVLVASLLIGWFTGQLLLCLCAGLAGYLYWQYRAFRQLLLWLHRRSDTLPPESPGLVDEIAHEFEYLRSQHTQRKQKLSGILKRFQQAIAALPDAVVVLGENDEIEWANGKAAKYIGIRWPDDAGRRISNLVRYPKLAVYLADESRRASESRLEIVSPVKPELRIEIRVAPYGENQRLLVARNITRLHRINQMRADFIANASHELRTPLTVVAGYLEAFTEDNDGSPELWKAQIARMRQQTERMQKLIDDLLKLASLESEIDSGTFEKINIPEMIQSIAREARDLSGSMGHGITVDADPQLCLLGRYKELHSAFSNLIFNAVKYSPAGAKIEVSWYQDEDGAHFQVRDFGEGIAPEHIPRITERFYRVDAGRSREKGGTGLGLSIVKHVLARHRARLDIQSAQGRGSTFRCDFPPELLSFNEQNQHQSA